MQLISASHTLPSEVELAQTFPGKTSPEEGFRIVGRHELQALGGISLRLSQLVELQIRHASIEWVDILARVELICLRIQEHRIFIATLTECSVALENGHSTVVS